MDRGIGANIDQVLVGYELPGEAACMAWEPEHLRWFSLLWTAVLGILGSRSGGWDGSLYPTS